MLRTKLSVMMFLQFFIWGAWLPPSFGYFGPDGLGFSDWQQMLILLSLASMALGGTVVVLPKFEPRAVIEAIERHRVTYMFLPPTAIYMLLAEPGIRDADLSSLEYISYAGAPMSLDRLREAIDVLGPVMNASFGQTEAPMCVTAMPPHEHLNEAGDLAHPGSCGRANLLSIASPVTNAVIATIPLSGDVYGFAVSYVQH